VSPLRSPFHESSDNPVLPAASGVSREKSRSVCPVSIFGHHQRAWGVLTAAVDIIENVAVAFVGSVVESEAGAFRVWLPAVFVFPEAGYLVTLTDRSDGVRYVVQFVGQRVFDGSPANGRGAEHQSDDQH